VLVNVQFVHLEHIQLLGLPRVNLVQQDTILRHQLRVLAFLARLVRMLMQQGFLLASCAPLELTRLVRAHLLVFPVRAVSIVSKDLLHACLAALAHMLHQRDRQVARIVLPELILGPVHRHVCLAQQDSILQPPELSHVMNA